MAFEAGINSGWVNNCGTELFTLGWVGCDTQQGAGSKKRKAERREQDYKKAFDAAKYAADLRRGLQEAVEAEKTKKQGKTLTKKLKPVEGITQGEIEQLASIEDQMHLYLAIEFEIRRLVEQKRRNMLALLLLLS